LDPKLYLDEDVNPGFAPLLTNAGIDTLSSRDAGMLRASDEEQLARATSDGRVIFTYNYLDFDRIATEAMASGTSHAGIIISHKQYFAHEAALLVRMLAEFLRHYDAEALANACLKLPSPNIERR
jgi:predicted nuclease of predicted toxin-antitoxin system